MKAFERIKTMTINEKALELHEKWNGKLDTVSKVQVKTREDLALAYTPGVAEPCKVIAEDPEAAYRYTIKSNTVAVVSDGSAVLGLGNIGPLAAMPVMEGKAVLFKEFGGINAFPICLDTQDTEEIIETVVRIAPAFGGINLEDISAPRCFEIEERLKKLLARNRHRRTGRYHQRPESNRQEEGRLPRRCQRRRKRRRCHHQTALKLRIPAYHHV